MNIQVEDMDNVCQKDREELIVDSNDDDVVEEFL